MMKAARKEPDMILIVGASGRLGSVVVQHLLAQGKSLRVMTRDSRGLAHLKQQGVEIVSGDLRDRASLASACQGVEQVLAAAHALDGYSWALTLSTKRSSNLLRSWCKG